MSKIGVFTEFGRWRRAAAVSRISIVVGVVTLIEQPSLTITKRFQFSLII